MAIETVASLVLAIGQSRLLDPTQLDALNRDLAGRFAHPIDLAKELVRRGWLNLFQLKHIFLGRGAELVLRQYVLLDLLGEGGMGEVFKALHRRLDRLDALKIVRKQHLEQADAMRRFQREARAAARLHHPNIVHVYDADEENGVHFLAMEYVQGTDLAKWVKQYGPLPPDRACDFIRQAALGLQHAHERGMVHRDVKPHNLLLTVDRRTIKILDMGLARLHATEDKNVSVGELTRSGVVMGTPDYMAPEQAVDSHGVDIRADIYSLGCTLYFLLAGTPPFPIGSLTQKLLWHQHSEPAPLESKRPDLPPGLTDVVRQMMAKQPRERFQTPADVAKALAHLSGSRGSQAQADSVPVEEMPVSADSPTTKKPGAVIHAEELDFSFAESAASPSAATSASGDTPRAPSDRTMPRSSPKEATGAWGTLAPPVPAAPQPEMLPPNPGGEEGTTVRNSGRSRVKAKKQTKTEAKKVGAGSHWGGTLAAIVVVLAVVGLVALLMPMFGDGRGKGDKKDDPEKPGEVDPTPFGELKILKGHDDVVLGVTFSSDGTSAVSAGMDRSVRLWNLTTGRQTGGLKNFRGPMACVAWSPVADVILCGGSTLKPGEKKIVCLWNISVKNDSDRRYFEMHDKAVLGVAFSTDGSQILSAGGDPDGMDSELFLWDALTGTIRHSLKGHKKAVRQIAFVPNRKLAVSCGMDRTVRIWNLDTGAEIERLPDQGQGFTAMAVSPDGTTLLAARMGAVIQVWKMTEGKPVREFQLTGHQDAIRCVAFTPDGKRVVSCSDDRTVRVWDLANRKELSCFKGHTGIITCVAVSPDGRRVLSASEDKTVRLWGLPR